MSDVSLEAGEGLATLKEVQIIHNSEFREGYSIYYSVILRQKLKTKVYNFKPEMKPNLVNLLVTS